MVTTPLPAPVIRVISRSLVAASMTLERLMSQRSSARVADRLACWPPGPPEGANDHSISLSGMSIFAIDPLSDEIAVQP